MAILNLSLNGADSTRLLTLFENDIKFAVAKSLTQTAQAVQVKVRTHIRSDFVNRKPNFEKSIKIRPATKQKLETEIYTMAGFATLQQTGGKQMARSGRLAVPKYDDLRNVKAGRKSRMPESFLFRLKSGGQVIASRTSGEFRILYYLKSLAYMPKRLNMLEIGERVAIERFRSIFIRNIQELSSAK